MKIAFDTSPPTVPHTQAKTVGAADFYYAINATFRFILKQFGEEGLQRYWRELGAQYMLPVSTAWQKRGLAGVADYWRAFFRAEPGAEVEVTLDKDSVVLEVRKCPAIAHLRKGGREIVPCYCQHCYYLSEAMAAPAGLTVRVEGGNGSCRQSFFRKDAGIPDQDFAKIREATC